MPLVNIGHGPIASETCRVERRIVDVEVRRCVNRLTVRMVRNQREMIRKAPFDFKNPALIKRGGQRTIHIVLQDRVRRIGEAKRGIGYASRRSPVLEGKTIGWEAICSSACNDRGARQ